MISFVQHGTGAHSEIFHPVIVAQHTGQYGRIAVTAAILYSCSERNTVADASHTDGIFARSLETTQPRSQFVLHFTLVEEIFTDSDVYKRQLILAVVTCALIVAVISNITTTKKDRILFNIM